MKKIYTQPEWKIVSYVEDPITTSGNGPVYDPDGLFSNGNYDSWDWE